MSNLLKQPDRFDFIPKGDLLYWKFQKSQISNHKYQTNYNDRNSKIQTMFVREGFDHAQRRRLRRVLNIGI